MKKIFTILAAAFIFISFPYSESQASSNLGSSNASDDSSVYTLELEKWGVYNDGTHPIETTAGINNALKWAQANAKTTFKIPAGTYEISKDSRINMVSNMTLSLDEETTLREETNGYEIYSLIYVGPTTENITITGGNLEGDRDTHDYSQKGPYTGGTHEWGYGINIAGGRNIKVDDVNIQKFTGDGIAIGGSTIGGGGTLKEANFEAGALDDKGNPINKPGKIRTVGRAITNFDKIKNPRHRVVNLWLPKGLSSKDFDVYYYRKDGSFISSDKGRVYSQYSIAPDEADYFRLVLDAPSKKGAEVQWMVIENAKNVVIQNNDIGYNRRQGITAGGEDVQILNNYIHHTRGTAPQSGIDIEPGFFPARNHLIKDNTFYNNKIQVVLAYGDNATFEGNTFKVEGVPGATGLNVHAAYRGITVNSNKFFGTGFILYAPNGTVDGNEFTNGSATIYGQNTVFKNGTFNDSVLQLNTLTGKGSSVSDTVITNTGNDPTNKASLRLTGSPVQLKNITLNGTPSHLVSIQGYGSKDGVYENLVFKDGKSGTTGLPSGTYKNSTFTYTGDKTSSYAIQYNTDVKIENSKFQNTTLGVYTSTAEATVKNSSFNYDGDLKLPPVYVLAAKNVSVMSNTFTAKNLTSVSNPIIKFGRFAAAKNPTQILSGSAVGNEIYTNLPVKGIHTIEAGVGSPSFTIDNNNLYNAKLQLSSKDTNLNNFEH